VGLLDRVFRLAELDASAPGLDPQELIGVRVHLQADVFPRREPHHRQLLVVAGEHDGPERVVLECLALDVADPSEHPGLLASAALATPRTRDEHTLRPVALGASILDASGAEQSIPLDTPELSPTGAMRVGHPVTTTPPEREA
jgi:hypothetical protein